MYDLKEYLESCECIVPQQLARHPSAQQPPGKPILNHTLLSLLMVYPTHTCYLTLKALCNYVCKKLIALCPIDISIYYFARITSYTISTCYIICFISYCLSPYRKSQRPWRNCRTKKEINPVKNTHHIMPYQTD